MNRPIKILLTGAAFVFLSCAPSRAQSGQTEKPVQTITLKDGTVLKGHLAEVTEDFYFIDTKNLGTVKVPVSDLSSITTSAVPQLPQAAGNLAGATLGGFGGIGAGSGQVGKQAVLGQMQMLQSQLMGDPNFMAFVEELMQDPEVMELMQDPSILQDAMSMDPKTIQNNQSIQKLLNNPKMKQLLDQATQKTLTP